MKFISIFLDRPRILFLTLAFILLSGISSVFTLPIQENPELAERWATVTISYPGATPERIETQVVDNLENKLNFKNIFQATPPPTAVCRALRRTSMTPGRRYKVSNGIPFHPFDTE